MKTPAQASPAVRTNTIGVATAVSRKDFNQYLLEVFNGVIEAAAEVGCDTMLFALNSWERGMTRIQQQCDGRVDALLLLAPTLDEHAARQLPAQLPIVSVHANRSFPGVVNLESSEEAGACTMVQHMLRLGHHRILHVAGPMGFIGTERRLAGYLKAHGDARIKPLPDHIVHSEFTVESGREVMRAWLLAHRGMPLPQAIFAASDAIAIGCIDALAALGLRTPQDISVVGFDDTALARAARLATVRQPLHEMGRRAVEILRQRIDGTRHGNAQDEAQNIVFPTEIVFSHSFSTPRAATLVIS